MSNQYATANNVLRNPSAGARGIRVTKMLIHATGTYNTQYRRPYATHLDRHGLDIISERLGSADKYTPNILAGVANQFIAPTAAPEKELTIANGWATPRLRFMMEVEITYATGTKLTEVLLGYTEHPGITPNGAVDPRMEFFVNSTMQLRETIERTPYGNQVYSSIVDSSHVLADNGFSGLSSPTYDQRMRPEDVYALISREHIPVSDMKNTFDMRTSLTNQAVKSRRSNSQAPNYMASILGNYRNAALSQEFGQDYQEVLSQARGFAAENPASRDEFLKAISQIRGTTVGNVFTWSDLLRLDPNSEAVTKMTHMNDTIRATVHQTGQTQSWQGADRDTQNASILSHSVPSIMMELMLTRLHFKSTNHTVGGQPMTTIINALSFSNTDLAQYLNTFIVRFEHEVMRDITYDNGVSYSLEMNVDLLGETWITLAIDNGSEVQYVTPSFCDALTVPVLTSNVDQAMMLATDFDNLHNTLQSNTVPGLSGNTVGVFNSI